MSPLNRRQFLTSASSFLLLSACAAPTVPQSRFFQITLPTPPARSEKVLFPGPLEIDIFSSNGVAGDRPLLYSADNGQTLMQRNYAYWAQSPAQMIRSLILEYLQGTNIFESVALSELRVPAKYRLRGRLISLFQNVTDKDGANGIGTTLALELNLLDLKKNEVLLAGTYDSHLQPKGSNIDDAAAAVNLGVADIFSRFVMNIREKK